jgi:hypothetical protein
MPAVISLLLNFLWGTVENRERTTLLPGSSNRNYAPVSPFWFFRRPFLCLSKKGGK